MMLLGMVRVGRLLVDGYKQAKKGQGYPPSAVCVPLKKISFQERVLQSNNGLFTGFLSKKNVKKGFLKTVNMVK